MSITPYSGLIKRLDSTFGLSLACYWKLPDIEVGNVVSATLDIVYDYGPNEKPIAVLITYLYFTAMMRDVTQLDLITEQLYQIKDSIEERLDQIWLKHTKSTRCYTNHVGGSQEDTWHHMPKRK